MSKSLPDYTNRKGIVSYNSINPTCVYSANRLGYHVSHIKILQRLMPCKSCQSVLEEFSPSQTQNIIFPNVKSFHMNSWMGGIKYDGELYSRNSGISRQPIFTLSLQQKLRNSVRTTAAESVCDDAESGWWRVMTSAMKSWNWSDEKTQRAVPSLSKMTQSDVCHVISQKSWVIMTKWWHSE